MTAVAEQPDELWVGYNLTLNVWCKLRVLGFIIAYITLVCVIYWLAWIWIYAWMRDNDEVIQCNLLASLDYFSFYTVSWNNVCFDLVLFKKCNLSQTCWYIYPFMCYASWRNIKSSNMFGFSVWRREEELLSAGTQLLMGTSVTPTLPEFNPPTWTVIVVL